jgi:uncharacterized protein YndB with AHSA1/START domain
MTEAKHAEETKKERRIERELEINVPSDEVWKALTDASKLGRWFPLEARVTPGPGGKIFVSWGPGCEGEAEIVAWEPGEKFAWKEPMALIEWTLESRGGKTIVHLLESGFLGNAERENECFDSTSYGWGFMLLSLQVALERHPGTARQVAWPRLKVTLSREEAYQKLLTAGALFSGRHAIRVEARRTVRAENDDRRFFLWTSRIRARAPRLLPHRLGIKRRALVAAHRRLPRPNRSPGLALRFLAGSIASGGLRQRVGAPLARNLSKLISLGNFLQAKARAHRRIREIG